MDKAVTRRDLGRIAGASTAAGVGLSAAGAVSANPVLDMNSPKGNLNAYVKLHTSVQRARVWYWYTGIMEAALANGPVTPIVAVDTLIRRDVTPTADGRFEVEMFEANYFHAVGDSTPLIKMTNPLNGRVVMPFHYREGPHYPIYAEQGIYVRGSPKPGPDAPAFAPRWLQAGDQIWTTNTFYIDKPYPLPIDQWPLEGNVRERVGSFANLFGSYAELADPQVTTARCTFTYEAFMEWWPWMLMGSTPGHMLWHAGGRKLQSLDDIPRSSRAAFEVIHPQIFEERPWTEFSMMSIDYAKQRTPVLR